MFDVLVKENKKWILTITDIGYKRAMNIANDYATYEKKPVKVIKRTNFETETPEIVWESIYK